MEVTIPALFKNNTARLPNGLRYPLGVGAWIRLRNGIPRKPENCSENAPRTHLSTARIVSPLVNGCAITIFFSSSAVAKSLSKTSTAIMVDVPMKPNSNPLVSIKSYFL